MQSKMLRKMLNKVYIMKLQRRKQKLKTNLKQKRKRQILRKKKKL
jgi:hypothetical protein